MIRNLKEYFSFSRREARALYLALFILFLSIIYRVWIVAENPEEIVLTDEQKEEIQLFIQSFEPVSPELSTHDSNKPEASKEVTPRYFSFNPNLVGIEDLLKLGMDEFVAGNIIKYREAGGVFMKANDLRKIYGMEEVLFIKLEPYITLPENFTVSQDKEYQSMDSASVYKEEEQLVMELNTANFNDLMRIRGMEPGIAGRIVNYRELIGGFYSIDQLKEVYGMTDSIRKMLVSAIVIDTSMIETFSPGSASYSDLLRHPYLGKKDVSRIFSLKDYYGDSLSFEHIIQNKILPESTLIRIRPYFAK